jgi:hypothetical protein
VTGYVLAAVLGGAASVTAWLLVNPACPECGVRRPVGRHVVAALVVGAVVGAWLMA